MYSLYGQLQGSQCSHGTAPISNERARKLFKSARKAGYKVGRVGWSTTRRITLPQRTAKELPKGYTYGSVELWISL